ncbi:SGNH/GDSL hydrolase family protein [Actinomyces sp. MRS3W]|uniref:SGNH/GDSL hydrolase family protein n=1 Tax=Actinomyces sp. MRS3W TaxID=2800796 RepID=UPI0028FD07FF|nr:SGNH/GDSL hydrolase family protein [Actinomyces sp. MRS3W]MDU0349532.1 SGNH/GDSL hydrolase family protein [Actinomyces sp. MRS3W]
MAARRWLFTGDSITEWGRANTHDPHDLGDNYVRLLADEQLTGQTVLNTGVGGDRLADLAARWQEDVVALSPDVLSVYIGINDTWRRYDEGLISPVPAFTRTLRELLAPFAAAGTPLVLISPFVLPYPGENRDWQEDLGPRIHAIASVAAELGALHVPLQQPMEALAARIGAERVAADGVHPTPAGHRVIADQWWRAWQTVGAEAPTRP